MSPLRAWIAPSQTLRITVGDRLRLSAEESTHLVRSLRARRGDPLVLLNGEGLVVEGRLESADSDGATVEVVRARLADLPRPRISLAQGMPKGGTMDDLVRTVCEAGGSEIIPLETARCEVKLDAERAQTRTARWRLQACEACKQSGHPWLAQVAPPIRFAEWLTTLAPLAAGELRLTGSLEFDAEPVGGIDFSTVTQVTWLIGPEGDLTALEYTAARQAGFRPVVLGPTVLRAENAALACVAITQALAQRR